MKLTDKAMILNTENTPTQSVKATGAAMSLLSVPSRSTVSAHGADVISPKDARFSTVSAKTSEVASPKGLHNGFRTSERFNVA